MCVRFRSDVFIKNPDGTEYIGQVWPGYTVCSVFFLAFLTPNVHALQVFPDWFAPNTLGWWTESLKNWSASGIEFSGASHLRVAPRAYADFTIKASGST